MIYDERLLGEEIKVQITAEAIDGLLLKDYDFTVEAYTSLVRKLSFTKADGIPADNGGYIFLVDSAKLGVGVLRVRVVAEVPDADFGDKLRRSPAEAVVLGKDNNPVKVVRYGL